MKSSIEMQNEAQSLRMRIHTDVVAINRELGRPEAQTDILIPSSATLSDTLGSRGLGAPLVVEEDVRLLLEGTFALDSQLGRHGCGC